MHTYLTGYLCWVIMKHVLSISGGIGHYKNLLEKDRNKYLEAENAEQEIIRHIGKPVAILKRKGKPITLRELRLIIETQPKQISMDECNDWGACGCFVDD